MLVLLLFVAILAISAAAVFPALEFQIKRDREEEMIHRAVQYPRAIRHFVKKFGRYPTRIEELENTNNIRFLRKRYKDPITGQDFKLLHLGEVQMNPGGGGITGAVPAGAAMNGPPPANGGPGGSTPGNTPGGPTAPNTDSGGSDSTASTQKPSSGDQLASQVFGGGPIVGVVSTSKAETIREFNNKNHYNQWQFIYDPSLDRGGLLNTPAQPSLQGAVPAVPPQGTGNPPSPLTSTPQQPQTPQAPAAPEQ